MDPTNSTNDPYKIKTLFVSKLPPSASKEQLEEFFGDIGPIQQCFIVTEKGSKRCNGLAFVQFAAQEDAQRALKTLNHKKWYNTKHRIKVEKAKRRDPRAKDEETREEKAKQKQIQKKRVQKPVTMNRIIIRNLPFKINENDIKNVFNKYGDMNIINIPKDNKGRFKGFLFIQYKNPDHAKLAINEMNGKDINGRKISVSFSIPSEQYKETINKEKEEKWEMEHNAENMEEVEEEESIDNSENYPDLSSDEEDDDDDDDEDEENDKLSTTTSSTTTTTVPAKSTEMLDNDVNEGKVIYVRNLSIDTTRQTIVNKLKEYGKITGVYIVKDPVSMKSRGSAFIHFDDTSSVESILIDAYKHLDPSDRNKADIPSSITIDGRQIIIMRAIDKSSAKSAKDSKNKNHKDDKRNLYLANEGFIEKGSDLSNGLSDDQLMKREQSYRDKMDKLKNSPNYSISKTRISVRYLPKSVNEKQLKEIFKNAAKSSSSSSTTTKDNNDKIIIKQVKILREDDGKSKGIAFIEFNDHIHALRSLRYVNTNSLKLFDGKRPLIEFAIENALKVHKLKKHMEQGRMNNKEEEEPSNNKNKKRSRNNDDDDRYDNEQMEEEEGEDKEINDILEFDDDGYGNNNKEVSDKKNNKKNNKNKKLKKNNDNNPDDLDDMVTKYRNKLFGNNPSSSSSSSKGKFKSK